MKSTPVITFTQEKGMVKKLVYTVEPVGGGEMKLVHG
jgi:hypothetical protein